MLLLPRLEDIESPGSPRIPGPSSFRGKERPSPLKSCFHLCSALGADLLADKTTGSPDKRRGKSRDPEEPLEATKAEDGSPRSPKESKVTPREKKKNRGPKMKELAPLKDARSTQRFNGIPGVNLSQAGMWLDSRSFCEADDFQFSASRTRQTREKRILTDPQRFVVKRCKESLIRRFKSVDSAFAKLGGDGSLALNFREFSDATARIISKQEAGILYRLLDSNHDVFLTLDELRTMLDEC